MSSRSRGAVKPPVLNRSGLLSLKLSWSFALTGLLKLRRKQDQHEELPQQHNNIKLKTKPPEQHWAKEHKEQQLQQSRRWKTPPSNIQWVAVKAGGAVCLPAVYSEFCRCGRWRTPPSNVQQVAVKAGGSEHLPLTCGELQWMQRCCVPPSHA